MTRVAWFGNLVHHEHLHLALIVKRRAGLQFDRLFRANPFGKVIERSSRFLRRTRELRRECRACHDN